jgi:deazaflavin-dependent oxidoreductase (nitroreductase family)
MNLRESLIDLMNRTHRAVFDLSQGRVLGRAAGMPVVRLTTIGRRSGEPRHTMLTAPVHDDDRVVIVASFGGADHHPAWYLNLQANPKVTVTMAGRTRELVARTAGPDERAALWEQIVASYGGYAGYEQRTTRPIPVVILEPADPAVTDAHQPPADT